jgi:hypothetical protein
VKCGIYIVDNTAHLVKLPDFQSPIPAEDPYGHPKGSFEDTQSSQRQQNLYTDVCSFEKRRQELGVSIGEKQRRLEQGSIYIVHTLTHSTKPASF